MWEIFNVCQKDPPVTTTLPTPIQVSLNGQKVSAMLVSMTGDYFSGNLRFVLDMDWPVGVPMEDFQTRPPQNATDFNGFMVYEISPPRHSLSFEAGNHLYTCSIENPEGRTLTVVPHYAANLRALNKIQSCK